MTSILRTSSGSPARISLEPLPSLAKSSFESEAAELPKESRFRDFHPLEHPHDRALSKLQQAGYLTEDGDPTELLSKKDILPFDVAITKQIRDLLNKQRTVKLLEGEVFLDYTLRKLFEYVYFRSDSFIDEIEVIGSSTFWLLKRGYFEQLMKNLGFENPGELFSEEFLESIENDPNDHDFRCSINSQNLTYHQTYHKLDYLGSLLMTFLALKIEPQAAQCSDNDNFNKIKNRAFYKLHHSKEPHYYIASPRIGAKSEVKTEIMFVDRDRICRKHLFIQDAARINLNFFLGFCSKEEKDAKKEIKPISDHPDKYLPFLHRMLMIIDAVDIGSIDYMGFPLYISSLLKGKICLKKRVEKDLAEAFAQLLIKYPDGAAGWWQDVVDKVFNSHHKPKEQDDDLKGKSEFIEKYKLTGKRQSLPLFMLKALEILQWHLKKEQLSQARNILASMALVEGSDNIYKILMTCIKNEAIEIDLLLALLQLFALNLYMQPKVPEGSTATKIFLRKHCGAPALQIYFPGDAEMKTMLLTLRISDVFALITDKMASLEGKALEDLSKLYSALMPARGSASPKNPLESCIKNLEWDVDELVRQAVSLFLDAGSSVKPWLLDFIVCLQPMASVSDSFDPLIEAFPRLTTGMPSCERREQFFEALASSILPKNPSQKCKKVHKRLLEALKDFDCQNKRFIELWALFLAHSSHRKWHQKAVSLFSEHNIVAKETLADALAVQSPDLAQTVMEEYLERLIEDKRFAALKAQLDNKQKSLISKPLVNKTRTTLLTEELRIQGTINAKQLALFKELMQGDLSALSLDNIRSLVETVAFCLLTDAASDAQMVWKLAQLHLLLKDQLITKWMGDSISCALKGLKCAANSPLPQVSALSQQFIEISIEQLFSEKMMQEYPEKLFDFLDCSLRWLDSAFLLGKLPEKIGDHFRKRQSLLFRFLREHNQQTRILTALKFFENSSLLEYSFDTLDTLLWLWDIVLQDKTFRNEWRLYSRIFGRFFDQKEIELSTHQAQLLPIIAIFIEEFLSTEAAQRAEYWILHYAILWQGDLYTASDRWAEWLDILLDKHQASKKGKGLALKESLGQLFKAMRHFGDSSARRWCRLFGLIADSSCQELKREVWKTMEALVDGTKVFFDKPHYETEAYFKALNCLKDIDSGLCYHILSKRCSRTSKHLEQIIPIERYDELFTILSAGALKNRDGEFGAILGILDIRQEISSYSYGNTAHIERFDIHIVDKYAGCRNPSLFREICVIFTNLTNKDNRTINDQKMTSLYMKLINEFFYYSQDASALGKEIGCLIKTVTLHYLYQKSKFLNFEQFFTSLTKCLGAGMPPFVPIVFGILNRDDCDYHGKFLDPKVTKALCVFLDKLIELNHHETVWRGLSVLIIKVAGLKPQLSAYWPKLLKSYIDHTEASGEITKAEELDKFFLNIYPLLFGTSVEKSCVDLFFGASLRFAEKMDLYDILNVITSPLFLSSFFAPVMIKVLNEDLCMDRSMPMQQFLPQAVCCDLTSYFTIETNLHVSYLMNFLQKLLTYDTDNALFNSKRLDIGHLIIAAVLTRSPKMAEKAENMQLFAQYFALFPFNSEDQFNLHKKRCQHLITINEAISSFSQNFHKLTEIYTYIDPNNLLMCKEDNLYKPTIKNIFAKLLKIKTRASLLQAIEILKGHGPHLYATDPDYAFKLVQDIAALCTENPFSDIEGILVFDRLMQAFVPRRRCFDAQISGINSQVAASFQLILAGFASVQPSNEEEHERLIISWSKALMAAYKHFALSQKVIWLDQHFAALRSRMISYLTKTAKYRVVEVNLGLLSITFKENLGNEIPYTRFIKRKAMAFFVETLGAIADLNSEEGNASVERTMKIVDKMMGSIES